MIDRTIGIKQQLAATSNRITRLEDRLNKWIRVLERRLHDVEQRGSDKAIHPTNTHSKEVKKR